MSETADDPSQRESGGDGDSAAHAYFRAIEDAFIRLRGAPFLLSPEDWRVARGWHEAGVPVGVVERVLERILGEREAAESGKRRRIRSLRYFDSAVVTAWKTARAVGGADDARQTQPLDVGARLSALVAALAATGGGARRQLIDQIRSLSGSTEEIEAALAVLDERMLTEARRALTPADVEEVDRKVEAGLARFEGRLAAATASSARSRLERQVLRRLLGLPLLSLFSPEARGEVPEPSPPAGDD